MRIESSLLHLKRDIVEIKKEKTKENGHKKPIALSLLQITSAFLHVWMTASAPNVTRASAREDIWEIGAKRVSFHIDYVTFHSIFS